jgi:hypothetical protein
MITQREAKQIVDFVIQELKKRQYAYTTDGRLDLSSSSVGGVGGGTTITGGQIKNNVIYDRHINTNADIRGTKVRVATVSERGTVELAQPTETASGLVVQASDYRLHDVTPSGSTQHDIRYWTKDQLVSTLHDYGASLIGIEDPSGYFIGTNVEDVFAELYGFIGDTTFIDLTDTPNTYSGQSGKVVAVKSSEDSLEFISVSGGGASAFIDLSDVPATYEGQSGKYLAVNESEDGIEFVAGTSVSGGDFCINFAIDGGGIEITADSKGYLVIPFDCTIVGWTIVSDISGSIVVDVKKATYSNFPTTTSIAGSEKPTISSARKEQDLNLTTWSGSIVSGDILEFVVDSVNSMTRSTVCLIATKD